VIDRKNKLLVVDAMACEFFHASPRKLSHHTTNPHNKTPVPPVKSEIGNVSGTLRYKRYCCRAAILWFIRRDVWYLILCEKSTVNTIEYGYHGGKRSFRYARLFMKSEEGPNKPS